MPNVIVWECLLTCRAISAVKLRLLTAPPFQPTPQPLLVSFPPPLAVVQVVFCHSTAVRTSPVSVSETESGTHLFSRLHSPIN